MKRVDYQIGVNTVGLPIFITHFLENNSKIYEIPRRRKKTSY